MICICYLNIYNPDAIRSLFKTARNMISGKADEDFILLLHSVMSTLLSNAMAQGSKLMDQLINGVHESKE
jgi:methyltransferase-like protein 6